MIPFVEIPTHLHSIAFNRDATPSELLQIVLAFGILWFVVFNIAGRILHKLSFGTKWLRESCERDYERGGKEQMKSFGIECSKEDAVEKAMNGMLSVLNVEDGTNIVRR